jgi:hypothetical protein
MTRKRSFTHIFQHSLVYADAAKVVTAAQERGDDPVEMVEDLTFILSAAALTTPGGVAAAREVFDKMATVEAAALQNLRAVVATA